MFYLGTDQGVYTMPFKYENRARYLNGKAIYDTIKLAQPSFLEGTREASIINIVESKSGHLLFCTEGEGLYESDGAKLYRYTAAHALRDNTINHVSMSGNIVLLSANSGLYLSDSICTNTIWKKIIVGRVSQAFLYFGKIYASTQQGLAVLNSTDLTFQSRPLIHLRSVSADSATVEPRLFREIFSDVSSLNFDLDVIDFGANKTTISYKLLGPLIDSGTVSGARLRLGRLPIGEYTLAVYLTGKNNDFSGFEIPFRIRPVFVETILFKILIATAGIMLVLLGYRALLKRRREREAAKIKNEQLLLEYKLIALKAQVNPHFMSNCLSAIQDMVMSNDQEKATFYIAEFGLMMRQILEYSSKQTISLQEELDLLAIYVELEQVRFDNKFTYQLVISDELKPKNIQVPPLILNPLVENAIWHSLLPIKDKREALLKIEAGLFDGKLCLSITDNGVGLKNKKSGISNQKSTSYGIQITEQRISNWNYLQNGNEAHLQFENLEDKDQRLLGTRVKMILPLVLLEKWDSE